MYFKKNVAIVNDSKSLVNAESLLYLPSGYIGPIHPGPDQPLSVWGPNQLYFTSWYIPNIFCQSLLQITYNNKIMYLLN